MRWIVPFIAIVVGACAPADVCPARPMPHGEPFLWVVHGPSDMVLFGTHQAGAAEDIPAAAWAAMDASSVFVAEAEEPVKGETFDDSWEVRRALELPDGQSLMKMLPDDDYIELRQRLGVGNRTLARMRPWVAMSRLVRTVFNFPDPNIPSALSTHAEDRKMAMEYLDTWMQQTVFLDMTVGADDLVGALHDPNLACAVAADAGAYRASYEPAFIKKRRGGPSSIDNEAAAIETRERVWTDKLIAILQSNRRAFVGIGVANLLGPTGIIERLRGAGYTVERMH